MTWTGERGTRLPADWQQRRRFVLTRDERRCYLCSASATQVDHIVAGDNHDYTNLAAICSACHGRKSAREGHDAQRTLKAARRRPQRHPGDLST